jgi:hypothetical protein
MCIFFLAQPQQPTQATRTLTCENSKFQKSSMASAAAAAKHREKKKGHVLILEAIAERTEKNSETMFKRLSKFQDYLKLFANRYNGKVALDAQEELDALNKYMSTQLIDKAKRWKNEMAERCADLKVAAPRTRRRRGGGGDANKSPQEVVRREEALPPTTVRRPVEALPPTTVRRPVEALPPTTVRVPTIPIVAPRPAPVLAGPISPVLTRRSKKSRCQDALVELGLVELDVMMDLDLSPPPLSAIDRNISTKATEIVEAFLGL